MRYDISMLTAYTYDAEGNMTSVSNVGASVVASYVYDALNHRVRVNTGSTAKEYLFNAAGQRASIWDGIAQTPLQGQFYWGSKPVGYWTAGATHFQHQDWVGTERLRTTYSGTVEGSFASLPFGDSQTTTSGTDTDAYHFAMLDYDSESQSDHAQFRQYDPTLGRWRSPDPYSGSYDGSNPQSFNRYAYVLNNPVAFVDPLGLDLDPCFDGDDWGQCPDEGDPDEAGGGHFWSNVGSFFSGLFSGGGGDPEGDLESFNRLQAGGYFYVPVNFTFGVMGSAGGNAPSNQVLNFMRSCEGFSNTAYPDSRGNCTIGYGHLLHSGGCTATDNSLYMSGTAAMCQFAADVESSVNALNGALSVPLNQAQFDAMLSLTFNMGMSRLKTHDVWRSVSAGNLSAVPGDIRSLGGGGPGMAARRANEANMFANGVYANACYVHP